MGGNINTKGETFIQAVSKTHEEAHIDLDISDKI